MDTVLRTQDVAKAVGVSKRTLLRWLHEGKIPETVRDRNNYRLFTEEDVDRIREFANLRRKPVELAQGPESADADLVEEKAAGGPEPDARPLGSGVLIGSKS